ncbi:hypothetical protein ACFWBA_42610, partial [Streptomyces sp. NPDC059949]
GAPRSLTAFRRRKHAVGAPRIVPRGHGSRAHRDRWPTAQVLKLLPAAAARDGVAEGRIPARLQGRLPVATPQVRESGTYENGRRHVPMSRLRGAGLAHAWPRIPRAPRCRASPSGCCCTPR